LAAVASFVAGGPAGAQLAQIDPNTAYQSQSALPAEPPPQAAQDDYQPVDAGNQDPNSPGPGPAQAPVPAQPATPPPALTPPTDTVPKDDVCAAAEGVFGKGAKGLAT